MSLGIIIALVTVAVLAAACLIFGCGDDEDDDYALTAYCAALVAEVWRLQEENRQLINALRDMAMATLSPAEARLTMVALQRDLNDMEPAAMRDPRWRPVIERQRTAMRRLGELAQ